MQMQTKFFPSHLQIETVNRICNARCTMCTINFIPENDKLVADENSYTGVSHEAEIMPPADFNKLLINSRITRTI